MQINVPHPLLTFQVPRPIGEPLDLGNEWGDKLTSSDALDLKSEWCSTSPKSAVMTMYDVLSGGTHTIRSTYTIMINHISLVSG
ncbi:hypothetical protein FOWG_01072 [Fusarium oxysporum f. sp. lycopersici MN25]|uniref:Uncharacterized protein n=1 Tax=Fusarium oxysporum Fo47 TaxID=660027 RepID=W9KIN1_FUSOX|nr:hypothetical protein FOZG_06974 [Fusarium oxysporum Fo47]EWZ41831.1 hypothetical protein FOZG_06974 [Fusarium oxysporum Fo47]EXA01070.1 hypothetical protein FOWG_01072 [Fusarium oxysporum f. sp. lycopersici MN25]EXA01071.1 hypothetical protein FOWG_01072 [Fusarium oxysporum f. sp. lycopersici MN25]